MALLRIPLGCLTSAILRLLLVAAILVAAYLLLVKPALHKADHAVESGAQRLTHCLAHAHGDPQRIERCTSKF